MQTSSFAVLLGLSLLIILISVLGGRAMRKRSEGRVPTQTTGPRSAIWSSPIWNVIGVLAGVIGAVVSIIGLFV